MIYAQTITDINGAVYKFGSSSFKWVYDQAIHFAKHMLFKDPGKVIIRYNCSNGVYIGVMRESITVIYDHKIMYIKRECV